MSGNKYRLPAMISQYSINQLLGLIRLEHGDGQTDAISQRLHRLLRAFELRRIDRIYTCVDKHSRYLLRSLDAGRRQIGIGVWLDNLVSMSDKYHSRHRT